MGKEVGVLCGWFVFGCVGFEAGAEVVGGGSAMERYLLWIELKISHCGGDHS